MSLKDLLKWEVPVSRTGYQSQPAVYVLIQTRGKTPTNRFVFNSAFVQDNEGEELQKKLNKNQKVGVALSIDRKAKVLYVLFDPPKEIPQFVGRNTHNNAANVQITNAVLVQDIWTLFEMPTYIGKQFLKYEIFKEAEGKKVWKLTYDPKMEDNMQLMAQYKETKSKKS